MGIEVASSFTRKAGIPLDDLSVVADLTARDAIEPGVRYEGMVVYVVAEATNFQLIGGIDNADWEEFSGSGGGGGGASLILKPSDSTPSPMLISTIPIDYYAFNAEDETLWLKFSVPNTYKPGKEIIIRNFKLFANSVDTSKFLNVTLETYLFRNGVNPLSLANAVASDTYGGLPVAVPSTANVIVDTFAQITISGKVDTEPVAPNDLFVIGVRINRFIFDDAFQGEVNMINDTLTIDFNG